MTPARPPKNWVRVGRSLFKGTLFGTVFSAIWLVAWVKGAQSGEFIGRPFLGALAMLCGVATFAYSVRQWWLWFAPGYEIWVSPGTGRPGQTATFFYRWRGKPRDLERVTFATGLERTGGAIGHPPVVESVVRADLPPGPALLSGRISLPIPVPRLGTRPALWIEHSAPRARPRHALYRLPS